MMSWSLTPRIILGALVVSGLGHVIHNLQEFPVTVLFGWKTLFPLAVTVLLGIAWYWGSGRTAYGAMAAWAAIVIVFGGGSVILFGFLPFVPEQSVAHYAAHVVYAVTQVPLLWVGFQGFRSDGPYSE
jgi:hypothetical protein